MRASTIPGGNFRGKLLKYPPPQLSRSHCSYGPPCAHRPMELFFSPFSERARVVSSAVFADISALLVALEESLPSHGLPAWCFLLFGVRWSSWFVIWSGGEGEAAGGVYELSVSGLKAPPNKQASERKPSQRLGIACGVLVLD